MATHRKRVRHYHEPGDVHELTFSCYKRLPLLTNDRWRSYLVDSVSTACREQQFSLAAFVFMPEHVHLLVFPTAETSRISSFLAAVKRPCSVKVKQDLVSSDSVLLRRLTVRERPGRNVFRFWQEGSGYDRNLQSEKAVVSAMEYIHLNPVRRGLCDRAAQWFWSSASFYSQDSAEQTPGLPTIAKLPAEFFG